MRTHIDLRKLSSGWQWQVLDDSGNRFGRGTGFHFKDEALKFATIFNRKFRGKRGLDG